MPVRTREYGVTAGMRRFSWIVHVHRNELDQDIASWPMAFAVRHDIVAGADPARRNGEAV